MFPVFKIIKNDFQTSEILPKTILPESVKEFMEYKGNFMVALYNLWFYDSVCLKIGFIRQHL
jgi:hypothetical protein